MTTSSASTQIARNANSQQLGPTGQTVPIYACAAQCGRNTVHRGGRCGACAQQLLLQQQEERQAEEAQRLRLQVAQDKARAIEEGRQSLAQRQAGAKPVVDHHKVDRTNRERGKLVGTELKKLSPQANDPPLVSQQELTNPEVKKVDVLDPVAEAKAKLAKATRKVEATKGRCPTDRKKARADVEAAKADFTVAAMNKLAEKFNRRRVA